MPELRVGDRTVRVDSQGFMVDPDDWTTEVAGALAESVSLAPLTRDHWRVIMYVRRYYQKHNTAPMLRAICKRNRLNEGTLRALFPTSCRECMCKIAGLPQPTG